MTTRFPVDGTGRLSSEAAVVVGSLPVPVESAGSAVIFVESYRGIAANDAAMWASAIAAVVAAGGGTVQAQAGRVYSFSAGTVPKLPVNFAGKLKLDLNGCTIKLSSTVPRPWDPARTADYQTLQNIEICGGTIDQNNVGGSHHAIVGNYVAGASLQRMSFNQLYVHDVNVINAPVDPTLATARVFAVSIDLSTLASNESTQLFATNLTFKRLTINGAGVGIYIGGVNTNNLTTGTPNCWIDNIEIDDIRHDLGSVQATNFASVTVQIGGPGALVGTVIVNKVRGKNLGDVTVEIDQAENATVSNSTATDGNGFSFLTTNFRTAANVNGGGSDWSVLSQTVNWVNCRHYRKGYANTTASKGFVVGDIGATGNTIGTVNFTRCTMKRSATDTNSSTLGELMHLSGKVNQITITKCAGTITNSRCASGSHTATMITTAFDGSIQTVLQVRGLDLSTTGTIAGGTFAYVGMAVDQTSLSQYAMLDIDGVVNRVDVTQSGGSWGFGAGIALGRFGGLRAAGSITGLKFPVYKTFAGNQLLGLLVGFNGTFAPAGFVVDNCDFQQLGDGGEIFFDIGTADTANSAFFRVGDNVRWSNNSNVFGLTRSRAVVADYGMSALDRLVAVRNTAAARTITLPLAAVVVPREERLIIDESLVAGTNHITITCAGIDTFAGGATTQTISTNGGQVRLYSDGTVWYVVT